MFFALSDDNSMLVEQLKRLPNKILEERDPKLRDALLEGIPLSLKVWRYENVSLNAHGQAMVPNYLGARASPAKQSKVARNLDDIEPWTLARDRGVRSNLGLLMHVLVNSQDNKIIQIRDADVLAFYAAALVSLGSNDCLEDMIWTYAWLAELDHVANDAKHEAGEKALSEVIPRLERAYRRQQKQLANFSKKRDAKLEQAICDEAMRMRAKNRKLSLSAAARRLSKMCDEHGQPMFERKERQIREYLTRGFPDWKGKAGRPRGK